MNKQFPPEIESLIKRHQPKAAFISDIQAVNDNECQNCGGADVFCVFIATKGPFSAPNSPYGSSGESSHFDKSVGKNGAWWVGKSYTFPCPVCKEKEIQISVSQYPTKKAVQNAFTYGD